MKVGILNFHYCENFGAVLQCAALQRAIEELGHEVEVIDYRPQGVPQGVAKLSWLKGWGFRKPSLKTARNHCKRVFWGRRMMRNIEEFRVKYLNRTRPVFDENELGDVFSGYDAVVVGSDQVWNLSYDFVGPAYFLAEKFGDTFKRVSYAACSGHKDMPSEKMAGIAECLKNFDAISVRNKDSYAWVNEVSGLEPEVVCDPTVLEKFDTDSVKNPVPYEGYILTYVLGAEIDGGEQLALKHIKAKYGNLPVVAVATTSFVYKQYPHADHVVWDAGPLEWVSLIKNATFMFTDSFHGLMLAIKSRVPAVSYYKELMRAGRLLDTAQRFGMNDRVITTAEELRPNGVLEQEIDFEESNRLISGLRESSVAFLEKALSDG